MVSQRKQGNTMKQGRLWMIIFLVLTLGVLFFSFIPIDWDGESSLPETQEPSLTYQVLAVYPHDPNAFTQGLVYLDGFLYESTGRFGDSSLRQVLLESGEVIRQVDLSSEYFGEGLTFWEDTLIQLTWKNELGFVYDRQDFALLDQFNYATEGWGLTQDGEHLIMSDGSSSLYFLSPETFEVVRTVTVTYAGEEVVYLNELEFIKGEVFANILNSDDIVRINPETGEVAGRINLAGILPEEERTATTDVLNGIAYDAGQDRLFVTGKCWPNLYEIRLVPIEDED
jgi:glutamine cyclotransferase